MIKSVKWGVGVTILISSLSMLVQYTLLFDVAMWDKFWIFGNKVNIPSNSDSLSKFYETAKKLIYN